MATNYPGSLDTGTQQPSPSASTEMDDAGFEHDAVHTNHSGAIIALETKVGTGDSNAVANSVLAGTGAGTSAWTTGALANDISGNAATATSATSATTATNLSGGTVDATGGSAASPSISFSSDPDTGMYSYAANALGFATGGSVAARIDGSNDLYLAGDYFAFNSVSSVDDSIRHTGTDIFFRTNGVSLVEIHRHSDTKASMQVVQEVDTTPGANSLAFRFDADTDTGIYRHGTNIFGIAAGGNASIAATSTGVAINFSTSTGTGTNCDLVTASVNGVSMYAIRRDTSVASAKSGIVDFDLSDADYKAMQPRSFVWNGQYIGPNGEFGTTNGDDVDDTIPEGSVLMRRAGFIYEEMLDVDLHLVGDHSIDWRALQAATVAKVQSLIDRVAALEAA